MSGPRVLVVSHLYPSRTRPTAGVFIHQHVQALVAAGVQVRVICPVPWPPPVLRRTARWRHYADILKENGDYEGVCVFRLPYVIAPAPWHVFGGLALALSLRWCLPRLRSSFDFDLLHAHTLTPDGWGTLGNAARLRVPMVCSIRGSDLNVYPHESRVIARASRRVLCEAAAIVTVSRALAEGATQFAPLRSAPWVIYNGVDGGRFRRSEQDLRALRRALGLPLEQRIILFVGTLLTDKGVIELIEAFAAVRARHRDAHLVLVGDGPLLARLPTLAAAQGVADALRAVGRCPHEQVAQYFRAADVFAFPSYAEGMPNALLEAMAAGLPCVATTVGGIPEVIEDGVTGLLVPPRSASALAAGLETLLATPELAQRLGRAAAERIAREFTWEANGARHVELYREVLERRS